MLYEAVSAIVVFCRVVGGLLMFVWSPETDTAPSPVDLQLLLSDLVALLERFD